MLQHCSQAWVLSNVQALTFKKGIISRIISCIQNSCGHLADVPHDRHPKPRVCGIWARQELRADPSSVPLPRSHPQPLELESAQGRKQKSGLVNQAGDFRDEADRRAEAEKCTEGSSFKYLIIECLKKAGRLLEHRSNAFSSGMGLGHFGYLCQVPFRHDTALIPPTPQRTVIKKLLPPKCAIMFSETQ